MKKKAKYGLMAIIMAFALAGCAMNFGDSSIEEEVTDALVGEESKDGDKEVADSSTATDTEPDDEIEPEPALEYVYVEDPDESLMTEDSLDSDMVEMIVSEADEEGNVETPIEEPEPDSLQIVFIGDSIFDSVRDETGIAHMVGEALEADVYNLSIGGTSAAIRRDKPTDKEHWTEPSLMGVIYTMQGQLANDVMDGYKAGEVIKELNPAKTDYFIIEYGTNDFNSYVPMGAPDVNGQYYFYFATTLEMAVDELRSSYPNAQILFCTPYYEQFWSADRTRFIGDVHSVNNGYGTLLDYIGTMEGVARNKGVPCLNMYDLMGIDTYTVDKMTVDGIHPNEEARRKYAGILIEKLQEMENEKNE